MVKKYFPHIFISLFSLLLLFLGFLGKNNDVKATDANTAIKRNKYYEAQFNKLNAKTTKKNRVKLSEIEQDIVIINFWASWCRPCVSEFKSLNKLKSIVGDENIYILGVNNDTENYKKEIKKAEKKYELSFESVSDVEYDLARTFDVTTIPTTFIYIKKKLYKVIDSQFDYSDKSFVKSLKEAN
jgi:peroxiredoxin